MVTVKIIRVKAKKLRISTWWAWVETHADNLPEHRAIIRREKADEDPDKYDGDEELL